MSQVASPSRLHPVINEAKQVRHQSHLWCWLAHDIRTNSQQLQEHTKQLLLQSRQQVQTTIFLSDGFGWMESRLKP